MRTEALNHHPACRIPALPLQPPMVPTENGELRPERAILYDRPFLVIHHYLGAHDSSGRPITRAELAGLAKTAKRLEALVRRITDPESFTPLHWPEPEHIIFSTSALHADCALLQPRLVQAEELCLSTLSGIEVLEFWRC